MLKQLDTLIGFVVIMSFISLLIMTVTQVLSALFGLRGKNLADALEAMLYKIDPTICDKPQNLGKSLADYVLTHPVISDSTLSMKKPWPNLWRRASAIRADEFLQILKDVADSAPSSQRGAEQSTTSRTEAVATSSRKRGEKPTPEELAAAARGVINLLKKPTVHTAQEGKPAKQQHREAHSSRRITPGNETEKTDGTAAPDATLVNFEKWFKSAQDRAQQWFATHTRLITVTVSVLLAFVLQLDAPQLLHRISSDADVRSKLVAQADTVQKQTDALLRDTSAATRSAHEYTIAKLKKIYPEIGNKLDQRPETADTEAIGTWLDSQLADDSEKEDIIDSYYENLKAAIAHKTVPLENRLKEINEDFKKSGLEFFPDPYPCISEGKWSWPWPHLLGILASAALLSLGAPFWFNTLKSLTNLRPLLAREVDKNPTQSPLRPEKETQSDLHKPHPTS
jgi:hypothetical protein